MSACGFVCQCHRPGPGTCFKVLMIFMFFLSVRVIFGYMGWLPKIFLFFLGKPAYYVFGANLNQFSSKYKIYFFLSELFFRVHLRILEVYNSLLMSPSPRRQGFYSTFKHFILSGRCEFTRHNRDKKLKT